MQRARDSELRSELSEATYLTMACLDRSLAELRALGRETLVVHRDVERVKG